MYVCICNGVTDHHIREAAGNGCRSMAELTMRTGCGANCGSCLGVASELLDEHRAVQPAAPFPVPVLSHAA